MEHSSWIKGHVTFRFVLLASKFGYILTGKYVDSTVKDDRIGHQVVSACLTIPERIHPCLSELWDLDKI